MFKHLFSAMLSLMTVLPLAVQASGELEAREYEIKAAFLLNLGSFIRWPDDAFSKADSPFQVCIAGYNPFGESLEFLKENRSIQDHPISIQHYQTITSNLKNCHILFIDKSLQANLSALLEILSQHPVLTVADMWNFTKQGGMVQFIIRSSKIRLRLAPSAFKQAALKPSSDLIRIADSLD